MYHEYRLPMLAKLAPALLAISLGAMAAAQNSEAPPPVTFTAEQDHQNMMDQLGIRALRPGKSSDAKAPNGANYDEQSANPYPNLPDVLKMNDGREVTNAEMWWQKRRPEIVEDLEREVYGRIPASTPKVTWTVAVSEREFVGFTPVAARKLIGHLDNAAYPLIDVNISMVVVTPANATKPVPLLMMFGPAVLPAPMHPPQQDLD